MAPCADRRGSKAHNTHFQTAVLQAVSYRNEHTRCETWGAANQPWASCCACCMLVAQAMLVWGQQIRQLVCLTVRVSEPLLASLNALSGICLWMKGVSLRLRAKPQNTQHSIYQTNTMYCMMSSNTGRAAPVLLHAPVCRDPDLARPNQGWICCGKAGVITAVSHPQFGCFALCLLPS